RYLGTDPSSQSAFSFAGQSSRAADRSRILIPRCVLSPSDAEFLNRKPENKELRLWLYRGEPKQ
ncbi:hypothetical protein, partial [Bradyrhizobium diazoefficiens]|uniref:hypothetical protein n=1 Tax=Bradyrhizobium diazoefficiens TaxID=1355477 RepID=UPI0012FF11CF